MSKSRFSDMAGLIGKKLGMAQIFTEEGKAVGVTVLEVGPCPVVQVKTEEIDGYEAIQLGFGRRKDKRVKKPEAGNRPVLPRNPTGPRI